MKATSISWPLICGLHRDRRERRHRAERVEDDRHVARSRPSRCRPASARRTGSGRPAATAAGRSTTHATSPASDEQHEQQPERAAPAGARLRRLRSTRRGTLRHHFGRLVALVWGQFERMRRLIVHRRYRIFSSVIGPAIQEFTAPPRNFSPLPPPQTLVAPGLQRGGD